MSPQRPTRPGRDDDTLLRPNEVADLFGVRTPTIARWAREGMLTAQLTPGGHRRYRLGDIRELLGNAESAKTEADRQLAEDAVRLYEEGWNIRQVAARFQTSYGVMRRILKSRTTLRTRGGLPVDPFEDAK